MDGVSDTRDPKVQAGAIISRMCEREENQSKVNKALNAILSEYMHFGITSGVPLQRVRLEITGEVEEVAAGMKATYLTARLVLDGKHEFTAESFTSDVLE